METRRPMEVPNRSILRDAFVGLLDDEITLDLMLFTSFGFDPDFFEQNVLLQLDDSTDRLQRLEEIENIERLALERGVVVFHDMGQLSETSEKVVGIPTVPIAIPEGFFHPKVIVVSGTKGGAKGRRVVHLMVSSANLTRAGWGKNLEVASCIKDVSTPTVAGPLSDLLRYLSNEGSAHLGDPSEEGVDVPGRIEPVIDHLEQIAASGQSDNKSPRLHVTVPKAANAPSTSRHLLDYLANETEGPLTIGSPYFTRREGSNLFDLLEEHFAGRELTIAPGLDEAQRVEMKKEHLTDLIEREGFSFANISPADDKVARFQHLKYFVHGGGSIVGSHNATLAALGGLGDDGKPNRAPRNVEVSIEWPDTSMLEALQPTEPPFDHKEVIEPPEPTFGDRSIPRFSLIVDWSEKVVIYRPRDDRPPTAHDGYAIAFLTARSDGDELIALQEFERRDDRWEIQLERPEIDRTSVAETKKYFLCGPDGDEPLYVGFINERNRERRKRLREPSPFHCLQIWCRPKGRNIEASKDARPLAFSKTNADREAHLIPPSTSRSTGALGNYFYIYRAAAQMLEYLAGDDDEETDEVAVARSAQRRARDVLEDGSGSIRHIVDYLIEGREERSEVDGDRDVAHASNWLFDPLPAALLATELEIVMDRVDNLLIDRDGTPSVGDEEQVEGLRKQLKILARPLEERADNTGDKREFLWRALANPDFFEPILEQGDEEST